MYIYIYIFHIYHIYIYIYMGARSSAQSPLSEGVAGRDSGASSPRNSLRQRGCFYSWAAQYSYNTSSITVVVISMFFIISIIIISSSSSSRLLHDDVARRGPRRSFGRGARPWIGIPRTSLWKTAGPRVLCIYIYIYIYIYIHTYTYIHIDR